VKTPDSLWIKIGAIATVLGVYLLLAGGLKWFPFASSGTAAVSSSSTTGTSPSTHTAGPASVARSIAYLDASAPSSGGPVGRGLASISGQNFPQSIWLQFPESCCGSQQSVAYSVPSGYRQFTGMLGEQEVAGTPSGYTMLFSVLVNGLQVIDNQQVQLGDPPVPIQVPLPAESATIEIDVTADCPNIYCVGNAVIGNARVIPIRAG